MNYDLHLSGYETYALCLILRENNDSKIEDDLFNEKLFNHLKEFANIKETIKTTDQIKKEREKNG